MCESFLPILYLHLCYSIIFPTMSLFVRVLSNMIDPTCCVCCLVTISSCLFLMQTTPKFDCCERSLVYVAKAFEDHGDDNVILISSTNSERSSSCRSLIRDCYSWCKTSDMKTHSRHENRVFFSNFFF